MAPNSRGFGGRRRDGIDPSRIPPGYSRRSTDRDNEPLPLHVRVLGDEAARLGGCSRVDLVRRRSQPFLGFLCTAKFGANGEADR
jgi:hypothetical protein